MIRELRRRHRHIRIAWRFVVATVVTWLDHGVDFLQMPAGSRI